MADSARESGVILTIADVDDKATRIASMWDKFNIQRIQATKTGDEARQYVFATDINATTANNLPHKNRTHVPKLTELSDTLQSHYYEATLSLPDFFQFQGSKLEDQNLSSNVEGWIQTKLEQKKFRETVGRQLIADYVIYGNCFAEVDYVTEYGPKEKQTYKGLVVKRISPLDIVFNPMAESFYKSPKIVRKFMHLSELSQLAYTHPNQGFDQECINKLLLCRNPSSIKDWVQILKESGIKMDGFNTWDEYFRQDMVEVLIYRGDTYDPTTGQTDRKRVVYVVDRTTVIRDVPNNSPSNFDGVHHASWRVRTDNLWGQGPLDNLVGMQYRINHLENLKADVFDEIAHPIVIIQGNSVSSPSSGWAPGAVYYTGIDEDVKILRPDATILNTDNQIEMYFRKMEDFAGAPPQSRGIRTPGEKTAFEVSVLDSNSTKMFVDKAKNFEMMIEQVLLEGFHVMVQNFDSADYAVIFNDVQGEEEIKNLSLEDVSANGQFVAVGARHWVRRNREVVEMRDFMAGPMKDPGFRAHIKFAKLAERFKYFLEWEKDDIIEPYAGIKEQVTAQAVAEAEKQRISSQSGLGSNQEAAGPPGQGLGQADPQANAFGSSPAVQPGSSQNAVPPFPG